MLPLLSLIIFVPLAAAILVLFLPNDKWIKTGSIILSLVPLALSIWLWVAYAAYPGITFGGCGSDAVGQAITNGSKPFFVGECYPWIQGLGVNFHLGVDGISVPLIFLTTLLTTVSLYYSARVINHRVREFFFLFLLLETGMLGVFASLDFFLFYIFWEVGLVPMYFLIGIWGHDEDRPQYSAIKFFLYTLAGSVFMLLAIIAIYLNSTPQTFDMTVAMSNHPFAANFGAAALAFVGFFLAFSIKVPLWPFHTWLPDAHTAAPTAGSVILAGILLKLGTYGYIRFLLSMFPDVFRAAAPIIGTLAVISIVYGALVAMAQTDFKRLIAYSSVNHMGYVVLGIAAAAALPIKGATDPSLLNSAAVAVNGAVLEMLAHGLITGALFFLVGMLYERTHTRDLKAFGGLGAKVPVYGALLLLAAFASLGLPGLAGFVAEFLVLRGAFAFLPWLTFIALFGVVITAAYFLWKVIQGVLLGTLKQTWVNLPDLHGYEIITLAPLLILTVIVGLYPQWLIDTINSASTAILKMIGS
ncbi:MAG: NADH-quinone oxidoreductase subunit M [Anaerolineae bacterium]